MVPTKGQTDSYRDVLSSPPLLPQISINQTDPVHVHGDLIIRDGFVTQPREFIFHSISFLPPVSVSLSIKLNESNYLLWKEHLESYIIAYGLESLIDGTPPPSRFLNGVLNPSFLLILNLGF